ncbi:MAG: MarR family transcriptional regulator [Bacteroidota bacterium]
MSLKPKHVGTYLDRASKLLKQTYLRSFRELGSDLSTEQWVLLDILYKEDGVSQAELASNSYKNAPTVSRIIDLMVGKNLLQRRRFPNDRRRYRIYLTTAGKELYEKLLPKVEELRQQTWSGLNEHDYEELKRILSQVIDNFPLEEG